ncbi:unnamed protein product [Rotaria magnacalcarata]|uniref:Ig-like domain-containing protein n=1 Tax=Rotaria magnacalcarata TaxID=392030 RepID=A0A816DNX4_9BILA|nr:unnamed protein product [Rotaria magnacalcarata]CAF1635406.1 unnamed protein product [Rotaria magnacalcarata]CAF2046116.1 unnamed protein product [Rotaria magnacalcarata]CAF2125305.1 unnamed protein product [Rotaria magnacalcarata]CAF2142133.1 unnamed protein product [Rotaria magnacalcarata]
MLSIVVIIYILLIQQPYQTYQLETIQVTLASTVELPCSIGQNIEPTNPAKIIWIRDDRADIVSLDSVITVRDRRLSILTMDSMDREERILRITNVEEQDQGLYRCVRGDITLNEILLDILIPPRIISHSPEHMRKTIREGHNARFSCTASGRPTPVIVWHVNGLSRPAIVTTITGKNESILILRNVSRFDSGRVDCSASNTLSTVNRQFLLHVKYKPTVTVPFHLSYFRLYDSVTITCRACSLPSTTLFDFFRPKQVAPIINDVKDKFDEFINQTCRQLTITLYLGDSSLFGAYVCRARNSIGISHADFVIKELVQSTKYVKYITESRPSTSLSSSSSIVTTSLTKIKSAEDDDASKRHAEYSYKTSNTIKTEVIARKNQAYQLSTSLVLILVLFIISQC